jgi:3,4-dihydroxy-9,10-secoandrosta-1,3,5(10)-triene-9,17-dione 4,5-dioxygenase
VTGGDREITGLGYVVLTAPDVHAWRSFGEDLLGLQLVSDADALVFRVDERPWRVRIERGEGGLGCAGWEVANARALDAVVQRLADTGVAVECPPELASERGVNEVVRVQDPAGNTVELFHGQTVTPEPFASPRGVRFVTGGLGLGHIVLATEDISELSDFYLRVLGFQLSDTVAIGPISLEFFHVNPRHHSLALAAIPGDRGSLSHLMLEVDDIDGVGRALDLVKAGAAPLTRTLGKHSNDHMVSFYVRTPSGFDVEYGWNGRTIDHAEWTVSAYDSPSLWGHTSPASGGAS